MGEWDKYVVTDTTKTDSSTSEWNKFLAPEQPSVDELDPKVRAILQQNRINAGLQPTYDPQVEARRRENQVLMGNQSRITQDSRFNPPLVQAAMRPFSKIAEATSLVDPRVAGWADAFNPVPGIARATETAASVPSAPDVQTGISRAGLATAQGGMAAMQGVIPMQFGIAGAAQQELNKLSPEIAQGVGKAFTPFRSFGKPQGELKKNAADALDIGVQAGVLQQALKAREVISSFRATRAQFKPDVNVNPSDVPFERGAPRSTTRGGTRGQRTDIALARADLSHAFKDGIISDPTKSVSENVQGKLRQRKVELFADEQSAANRHPNAQVELAQGSLQKILDLGKEVGNEGKYAAIKDIIANGGSHIPLPDALQTLTDLNADIRAYRDIIAKTGSAPSPSARPNLSELQNIKQEFLQKYIKEMDSHGESGVRQNRIRYGALSNLQTDIEAAKNKIDATLQSFREHNVQKRPYSLGSAALGNVFRLLKKSPADYVAEATKNWAKLGFEPKSIETKAQSRFNQTDYSDFYPTDADPKNVFPEVPKEDMSGMMSPNAFQQLDVKMLGMGEQFGSVNRIPNPYPPFPKNRMLPPSNVQYAPEYQSQSSGYKNASPQMADQLQVVKGRFNNPETGNPASPINTIQKNQIGGLGETSPTRDINIKKLGLTPKDQSVAEKIDPQDVVEIQQNGLSPFIRRMLTRRIGKGAENLSDLELFYKAQNKPHFYLNEATPEHLQRLVNSGEITQREMDWANRDFKSFGGAVNKGRKK